MTLKNGDTVDIRVDDLASVIFCVKQNDGTILELEVEADTANQLRVIEEQYTGALNSDGIMHLEVVHQALVTPEGDKQ